MSRSVGVLAGSRNGNESLNGEAEMVENHNSEMDTRLLRTAGAGTSPSGRRRSSRRVHGAIYGQTRDRSFTNQWIPDLVPKVTLTSRPMMDERLLPKEPDNQVMDDNQDMDGGQADVDDDWSEFGVVELEEAR